MPNPNVLCDKEAGPEEDIEEHLALTMPRSDPVSIEGGNPEEDVQEQDPVLTGVLATTTLANLLRMARGHAGLAFS
jgi:hypothetical protein